MGGVILRVRKKGIIILPRELRGSLGIEEGGELLAEVQGGVLTLKPFRPTRVRVDHEVLEGVLREEFEAEERAFASYIERLKVSG